ncbi:glycoside hydrolase 5 family protein [Georgenia alba]|uniref:Glycosyl hydrolase n=1 Tax=Georgenia alba TaxID=2233858 RepID=A0ABW2QD27_9MICO
MSGAAGGMRFGANYTPSEGWFHSWYDLDLDAVARDMGSLAALGLDHVRIFPLWETLQPNRTLIRDRAVADVVSVVDVAHEHGLGTSVDVLQGHLSSFDFLPSWVLSWHRRNIFADEAVVEAQERLVTALGSALTGRPGFLGLTLGNETNQFGKAIHPDRQALGPQVAGRWLERLLTAAHDCAPGRVHSHSFDDDVWFVDSSGVTPEHAAGIGDVTTVHSWVFTGVARHFPPDHPAHTWFARYLLELAAAWGGPDRPLWLQEVGAPVPHLGADRVPDFARETLRRAVARPGLWGVTWWCSHDVDRSLADFPELEYSLGLLAADRSVKPLGAAVRDVLPELRELATRTPAPAAEVWELPTDDAGRVVRSASAPGSPLFAAWVEAAEAGTPPRFALPAGAVSLVTCAAGAGTTAATVGATA